MKKPYAPVEADEADEPQPKKKPMKKKGKPTAKSQPAWAGIANKMLGNE